MNTLNLSNEAINLFKEYAEDASNWSGTPLIGGNVFMNNERKGYLTDLKKKGLIITIKDEGDAWISFTPEGIEYAQKEFNIKIETFDFFK